MAGIGKAPRLAGRTVLAALLLGCTSPEAAKDKALVAEHVALKEHLTQTRDAGESVDGIYEDIETFRKKALAAENAVLVAKADRHLAQRDYDSGRNEQALARLDTLIPILEDSDDMTLYLDALALKAIILTQAGRAEEAVALNRKALAAFDGKDNWEANRNLVMLKSNIEFSLSQALMRQGDMDEALRWQLESLNSRKTGVGEANPATIQATYQYAQALLKVGRQDEAEVMARRAVSLADVNLGEDHQSYARALEMLGIVLGRTGRPVDAASVLDRALILKSRHEGRDGLFFAYGLSNLGSIQLDLGRYKTSRLFLDEAYPLFVEKQGEKSPFAATIALNAAVAAYGEGDWDIARKRLTVALQTLPETDESRVLAEALRGDLFGESPSLGMLEGDRLENAIARSIAARLSGEPDATELLTRLDTSETLLASGRLDMRHLWAAEEALRAALASNDMDSAVRAAAFLLNTESAQARARAQQIAALPDDRREEGRELVRLRRAVERAKSDLFTAIAKTADTEPARGRLTARQADVAALEEALGLPRAVLDGRLNAAALQASPPDDTVLLGIVPGLSRHYSLIVDEDGVSFVEHAPRRGEIAEQVRRAGDVLRRPGGDPDTLRSAGEALFPESVRSKLGDARNLYIVASGAATRLPLGALIMEDGRFLSEAYTLSTGTALLGFDSTEATEARHFVGMGPPDMKAEANAVQERIINEPLPDLPNADDELRAIATSFETSDLWVDAQATEARVKSGALAEASVVAFATHGFAAGQRGEGTQGALLLGAGDGEDGFLETDEIAGLSLKADLVVLSACDTASPDAASDNGYSGLAAGFLEAGAQSLIVSHWAVRDDAAAFLTTRMVHHARGMSQAKALQTAMAELRVSDLPDAADPYIWAPFVLFSG